MKNPIDAFPARVLAFADSHGMLPAGSTLLCALSGGGDSMALLTCLLTLAKDMTNRNHLYRSRFVIDDAVLLVRMVSLVAKNFQKPSVEFVRFLDCIFNTRMVVDDKILVLVIFLLQTNERSTDVLDFVIINASALLDFVLEVVAEIS